MPSAAILVFDGRCPLCRATVRFLRKRARPGQLRFAPALSAPGRQLCTAQGLDPAALHAVLLITHDGAWLASDAVWRAATRLRWPWRLLAMVRRCPRSWREAVYAWIARRRPRR
jgi:predicted DCC family thiol-disulfide oxidoreductase YuxK